MIFPTILETTFEKAKEKVSIVEKFTTFAQIDIADGIVVNGLTFLEPNRIDELTNSIDLELDLMINDYSPFLKRKYKRVVAICLYSKSPDFGIESIEKVKRLGYSCGVSFDPTQNEQQIQEIFQKYISLIDYVQFFAVIPGKQGGSFQQNIVNMIKNFHTAYPNVQLQVDGSVNIETISILKNAGAVKMVAGAAIFSNKEEEKNYIKLNERLNYEQSKTD